MTISELRKEIKNKHTKNVFIWTRITDDDGTNIRVSKRTVLLSIQHMDKNLITCAFKNGCDLWIG